MLSTIERVLFLKGVDLFEAITGEDLASIAQIAEEMEAEGGEEIFHEGDVGDALYLVVDGEVRVHAGGEVLAMLGARQCFGEMSVLDDEPRSASVTAEGELVLLCIRREDFAAILAERPEIALAVIQVLTRRLREANRRVQSRH